MKKAKQLIKHIPFIMLLINGISFILAIFDIYLYDYWITTEISSHSLLTVLYMAFFAYLHRCCTYTLICISSLGALNVLNILYFLLPLSYYNVYAGLIIFTGIIFALIKWKKV